MTAGGSRASWPLHQHRRDRENDKQQAENQKHVGEGHNGGLLMHRAAECLQRHGMSITAERCKTGGQRIQPFHGGAAGKRHRFVQTLDVQIGTVVEKCPAPPSKNS